MSLPRSWLNQQASRYVPRGADWRRSHTFDHPNLHLYAISRPVATALPGKRATQDQRAAGNPASSAERRSAR